MTLDHTARRPARASFPVARLILSLLLGTACSSGDKTGDPTTPSVPVPVATVSLTGPSTFLEVGASQALTASVMDASGNVLSGRTVSFSSGAPSIATVSSAGQVTGVAVGTATITATSEGKSGAFDLTVTAPAPVASMHVDLASDLILEGTTTEVAIGRVLDANGNDLTGRAVTWSSSDPAVASVDASGRITAKAAGTAQITGTAEGKSGVATVTVEPRSRYEVPWGYQWAFINGSDPRMPSWDSGRQGYFPAAGDSREQMVVDETFSVPAGKEVTWENKIVWVRPQARGNIDVLGTLTIRNSLVLWEQTEHQQTRLVVKDGGTLRVEGSYAFSNNFYWINWEYEDGATVFFDHFQGNPWTSVLGDVDYTAVNASSVLLSIFPTVNNASIVIQDAHQLWFEMLVPAGTHRFTIPQRYQWQDEDLSSVWPGTSVSAKNSFVLQNDVSLNNDTQVTIEGATDGVGVGWTFHHAGSPYLDCELRDFGDPAHDEGVYYSDKTWSVPCNNSSLTLKNSLLLPSWPNVYGSVHLKIHNSNMADLRNFGSGGSTYPTMEVYGSKMTLLSTTNGGLTYVENSKVGYDVQVNGTGSTIYGFNFNTVSGAAMTISEEAGGKYVVLSTAGVPWD